MWSAITNEISGSGWTAEAGRNLGGVVYAQWEPFGNPSVSPTSRCYLPNTGSREEQAYNGLPDAHKAALLKLIWWQGVATLIAECVQSTCVRVFDPCADRNAMADPLERMLRPVRLADFGLAEAGDVVDPSRFGASHLACFALNAFLGRGVDLDCAYNDCRATRPNRCNDLPHYIAGIRTGSC